MKQEIVCKTCRKKMMGYLKEYPGEHFKFTAGKALRDYRCDDCNEAITQGSECYALGMWTDMIPLIRGWEKNFITPEQEIAV